MMPTWAGLALVLAAQGAVVAVTIFLRRRGALGPEASRKAVHIGSGVVALPLPWLFADVWPVLALCAASATALVVVRLRPALRDGVGAALHAVERTSWGEVLFPVSIGALFALAHGEPAMYVIPLAVLTFADAAAALVGTRVGLVRFRTAEAQKSVAGSLAFLAVTFGVTLAALLAFDVATVQRALLLAAISSVLLTLLEAVSFRGLDNLLLPVLGYVMLRVELPLEAPLLVARLAVAGLLLVGVLAIRPKRALLADAALATALFAYACWAIGGPRWLVAPLTAFVALTVAFRHGRGEGIHPRGAPIVVAMTLAPLTWLVVHALDAGPTLDAGALDAFTVSIAAALCMLVLTATGTRTVASLAGTLLVALPHALLAPGTLGRLGLLCALPPVAAAIPVPRNHEPARWLLRCAILFAVSIPFPYLVGGRA